MEAPWKLIGGSWELIKAVLELDRASQSYVMADQTLGWTTAFGLSLSAQIILF